jgi:Domain of unknown function (DUF4105)
LLCLVLGAGAATASTSTTSLAAEAAWLKLGHYERDRGSPSGWRSAIHAGDFFLDPHGATDPQRELAATLSAIAQPASADLNKHAACRFPARWLWLKSRPGAMPAAAARPSCPALDSWTHSGSVASLSLVFATGYLGNPASYYGHTLLKFNFREAPIQTPLLDVSVNYGAIVEHQDNPFKYMIKGLTGGYDGGFSHIQFYFHNHNYGEIELRDLWEYRLDLPQDAVDLIVAHAWEVLGKRYTYYFFSKNCAFRMGELLEIVDGIRIVPDGAPWAIPQVLVQNIAAATFRGKPLLAEVRYLPSRQSRFYARYRRLLPYESTWLAALADQRHSPDEPQFDQLPMSSRQAVLGALLDYYQFVAAPLERAPLPIRQAYTRVLAKRYTLEPDRQAQSVTAPPAPHLGRKPGWAQLGWNRDAVLGSGLVMRVRPAYYDMLDGSASQVRNAVLTMADIQVRFSNQRVRLDQLTIVDVQSVNPGLSAMPGDRGASWKLSMGAEQERSGCRDCLVARARADIGAGRQWRGLFGALYTGGALQSDRLHEGFGFASVSADLVIRPSDRLGLRCSLERRYAIGAGALAYTVATAEGRWSVIPNLDLRLAYAHDRSGAIQLAIGVYR